MQWAMSWIEAKNKVVYGRYTFVELAVMTDTSDNRQKYHLKVNFKVAKKNDRWIAFPNGGGLSPQEAKAYGLKWCAEQSEVVYGKYTYLESNKNMFKVNFRHSDKPKDQNSARLRAIMKKPVRTGPLPLPFQQPLISKDSWIHLDNCTSEADAKVKAEAWINKMNKVVYGKYTFIEVAQ